MNARDKIETFRKELKQIKDPNVKRYTAKALALLPDYFYEVPASSTGKYHPKFTVCVGGLVKHVKAAVMVAAALFDNELFSGGFTAIEKDCILSALLLHDGLKHGLPKLPYSTQSHPKDVCEYLANCETLENIISKNEEQIILECIWSHMGLYNKCYRTGKVILDPPENEMQKFVHLCDYMRSRKFMDIKIED